MLCVTCYSPYSEFVEPLFVSIATNSPRWVGVQLEGELEAARRAAHPSDVKGKEAELQRAKEEARRLGEERAKAQKVRRASCSVSANEQNVLIISNLVPGWRAAFALDVPCCAAVQLVPGTCIEVIISFVRLLFMLLTDGFRWHVVTVCLLV